MVDESVSASVEKITATLIATATLTITPSPLPTQAPTSTIVPEVTMTPSLEQFLASENFLFEQSNDFGCELPCWESLRIGQTTREEAVSLYKQVLGLESDPVFIEDIISSSELAQIPFYSVSYLWYSEERETFLVETFFDKETLILQELSISSSYQDYNAGLTPHSIVEHLGVP
ncbi:MAG: hypothetical protein ACFB51_04345, partial [Anaerolineae bacterium]